MPVFQASGWARILDCIPYSMFLVEFIIMVNHMMVARKRLKYLCEPFSFERIDCRGKSLIGLFLKKNINKSIDYTSI